jgi:hypothetical protein
MGGGGKSPSPAPTYSYTEPESLKTFADLATKQYTTALPGAKELLAQGMEALRTGGTAASIPSIQRATEQSKMALSQTLRQIGGQLAQGGLGGTPYGEAIKASATQTGETNIANTATQIGQWFMQMLPNFLTGQQTMSLQGMGQAAGMSNQGVMNALNATARGYDVASTNQTSKGNAYLGAMAEMAPKANCCFIFLEANDGVLHPTVRRYRDEHLTTLNRRGYYKLADFLVPKMQHSLVWKLTVRLLMTAPMTSYGKYFYSEGKIGRLFYPLATFWLKVYEILGKNGPYIRSNGEII